MSDIKSIVATNLAMLRKHRGLTQAELAEKFNYSDKAVCRWEHGETLPDINMLVALCNFYGITMNDLIDPDCTIETVDREERDSKIYRILSCIMVAAVVWLAATAWFIISAAISGTAYWLAFVWAVPISAAAVLRSGKGFLPSVLRIIIGSVLAWCLIAAIYLHLLVINGANMWAIFLLGLPMQVIIIIWGRIRKYRQLL